MEVAQVFQIKCNTVKWSISKNSIRTYFKFFIAFLSHIDATNDKIYDLPTK